MLIFFFLFFFSFFLFSASSLPSPTLKDTTTEFGNHTVISDFRVINRRSLRACLQINPHLQITTNKTSGLSNEEYVTVAVSGVLFPDKSDWIAMISPAHSNVLNCPLVSLLYKETGDFSRLPLLCHYPVKAQYLSHDPDYLSCENSKCLVHNRKKKGVCDVKTCTASLTFHIVNIRTEIEFVLFTSGFENPCWLKSSGPLGFANPKAPLYGHLSSMDSTATSMKLRWISGDKKPQQVQYGAGNNSQTSQVATFTQDEMCSNLIVSPAKDFGWHDPGYIHSAVMTGLLPSSNYSYRYGSDSVGWSDEIEFQTPPEGGSDQIKFLIVGDMGKTPRDKSAEHYIQPGALSVIRAMEEDIASGKVDSVFHIGDISYATGFLVEWDYFLHLITPVASRVPYMTAIGNHERDFPDTGSLYGTPDSGGECGVPYETYFPMPSFAKDKPWYSIEQGSVHFTVMSTEHNWAPGSEQYNWMKRDLGSVDRKRTPWVIFTGHRPMYSSLGGLLPGVDPVFTFSVESLLLENKVDLVFWGHIHNYERTCAVYKGICKAMPTKDQNGIDTYNSNTYSAPVHVIVGMGGFSLDPFSSIVDRWSLVRIDQYGYARVHATKTDMQIEFVNANKRKVEDSFRLVKVQTDS